MSNREQLLLRGSTDTSSVPMATNKQNLLDTVPSRVGDVFSRPKPAYTSPVPKQKKTEVATVSPLERSSFDESPGKVVERQRKQLNMPFKSKIDRRLFKKTPSVDSNMGSSMQSTACKSQPMRSIIKTRSQAEIQEDKKILFDAPTKAKESVSKKVRFDDMQTLGLGCGDKLADEQFLKEEELHLKNKKKSYPKANPQQQKVRKQPKVCTDKNSLRDIDPDHIIEGKRRRQQPAQDSNE